MWACQAIDALAVARRERTVEHGEVLVLEVGRAFDRVVLVDVGQDRADLRLVVAERAQRERHGLVDDLEHAAAGELLVLHQRDVRLDAGRVAVHHEADRAGGGQHGGLRVAEAVDAARGEHIVPDAAGRVAQVGRALGVDLVDRVAVHLHHAEHRLAVLLVAVERTDRLGELAAGEVGRPVQERGDRAADAASRRRSRTACPRTSAGCRGSSSRGPAAGTGGCCGRCRGVG